MSDLKNNQNFDAKTKKPGLCVNCHEFFGNKSTDGLCSKCYKVGTSNTLQIKAEETVTTFDKIETKIPEEEEIKVQETALTEAKEVKGEETAAKQKDFTRCFNCSKKVGLLGFKCQCEMVFCRSHRQPEVHDCSYDYGKAGRERLAKENVTVKADKLQRF